MQLQSSVSLLHLFHKLQGIGDSGQGIANAIIFIVFTRQVRKNIASWTKQHCCCYSSKTQALLAETGLDRDGEDDDDGDVAGSSADSLGKILERKRLTGTSETGVETPVQFSNTFEVI